MAALNPDCAIESNCNWFRKCRKPDRGRVASARACPRACSGARRRRVGARAEWPPARSVSPGMPILDTYRAQRGRGRAPRETRSLDARRFFYYLSTQAVPAPRSLFFPVVVAVVVAALEPANYPPASHSLILMAAVQSQRMPLGTAAAARLRVLDSSRNSQKGAVGLSSCRKRSLEDSENAAPLSGLGCSRAAAAAGSGLSTCSHSKRPRRGLLQLDVSISKRATTSAKRPPAINNTTPSTPSSFSSLQTPAGRSPRRATAKPFVAASYRRIHPPVGLRGVRAPFSIADALHGTFSGSNSGGSSSTVSRGGCFRRMPRSWDFAIHVDGPQEEMTNLMQHSAGLLAIRDDDEDADMRDQFGRRLGLAPAGAGTGVSKKARLVEERGKENIPPAWHSAGSGDADGDSHQQQQQQQPQQGEEGEHQAPTVSVDMPNAPARAVLGELDVERFADRHDVEADRAAAAAEALAAQEERHGEKEKGTQVIKTMETEAAVVEEDIKA